MKMRHFVGGLVGAALVLGLGTAVKAEYQVGSRQWMTDGYADSIFYKLHPSLNGRKLGADETDYVREWQMIRSAVSDEMEYRNMCGEEGWFLKSFDLYNGSREGRYVGKSLDRIADRIFYYRNPEMQGQTIQMSDRRSVNRWNYIRETITIADPCD